VNQFLKTDRLNNYACNGTKHLKVKQSDFFGTIPSKLLDQTEIFNFLKDLTNTEMNLIKIDDAKLNAMEKHIDNLLSWNSDKLRRGGFCSTELSDYNSIFKKVNMSAFLYQI
jgi:hypothetical protein